MSQNRRFRLVLTLTVALALGSALSLAVAFALAEGVDAAAWRGAYWKLLPMAVAARAGLAWMLGLHRHIWRYAGLRDLLEVGAVQGGTTTFLLMAVLVGPLPSSAVAVVAIDGMASLLGMLGARVTWRLVRERGRPRGDRRLVLVGAGDAGEAVARELLRTPGNGFVPVAFADDDPAKQGLRLHGLSVLGAIDELPRWCQAARADAVLLAIADPAGGVKERVLAAARATGLPVKCIPTMGEMLQGRSVTELRDLRLEELLQREPVRRDEAGLAQLARGRRVLVTGAAGSIGSELSRQLFDLGPAELVLLDHDENALFALEHELAGRAGAGAPVVPVLCSVRDADRLDRLFAAHRPELVFHAAAYKHVPVLEHFPEEAIRNNVRGTRNVAECADHHGADRFVLISTDKAVRPTSVMGASKRVAELLVARLSQRSATRFTTIRFGNVLGSNGSVLQLFREQVARGGPVTVTHPEMRRYFMSIPEAVTLVLSACAMAEEGGTFVLDMGQQVRIVDLAHHFIRLCGLEPGRDIAVEFIGLRPGEKLYEELWVEEERPVPTGHPSILRAPRPGLELVDLEKKVDALVDWADDGHRVAVVEHLRAIVPDYSGHPVGLEAWPGPAGERPAPRVGDGPVPVAELAPLRG